MEKWAYSITILKEHDFQLLQSSVTSAETQFRWGAKHYSYELTNILRA